MSAGVNVKRVRSGLKYRDNDLSLIIWSSAAYNDVQ